MPEVEGDEALRSDSAYKGAREKKKEIGDSAALIPNFADRGPQFAENKANFTRNQTENGEVSL